MKRNRKISKKMSVNAAIATHFGAVLAFFFIMVILNLLASSSCQQLSKSIGECRKTLARLEGDRNREMTNWESMKTPEKVAAALRGHGLAMNPPRAEQNVHLDASGRLYPGQYSVSMAQRRNGGTSARVKRGR